MSVYVVLLRGVNVGGKTKVSMAALRETCVSLGCRDVATYIQSGNVVLTSTSGTAEALRTALEAAIADQLGVGPHVMVRTATEMAAVVARNPYPDAAENTVHVAFLHAAPDERVRRSLDAVDCKPERLTVVGREIYLHLPDGMGRARLPVEMNRRLGSPTTVRNWRTTLKLAEMASGR